MSKVMLFVQLGNLHLRAFSTVVIHQAVLLLIES